MITLNEHWICYLNPPIGMPSSEQGKGCPSTLDILMKNVDHKEIKSEFSEDTTLTFISSQEAGDIDITDRHLSSYLGVDEETTEMFMKYFDDGVPLRMAKRLHELNLTMSATGPKDLTDTSINPSETVINELYEMWEDKHERMLTEEKEKKIKEEEGEGDGNDEKEENNSESDNEDTEESSQVQEFRIPPIPKRRKNADHDFVLRETVNCMKSLTEAVTNRDEFGVYGEHIANKLRNSGRSRIEISLVQREIDDIFLKLEMGMYEKIDFSNEPIKTSLHISTPSFQFSTSSSCSENGYHSLSSESSMVNTLTTPLKFDTSIQNSDTDTTDDKRVQAFKKI